MRKLIAAMILLFPAVAQAQRAPFPIPDPEIERRSFIVADGFEVNLFAADPIIAKPISHYATPSSRVRRPAG
jgi:hypothetical protein